MSEPESEDEIGKQLEAMSQKDQARLAESMAAVDAAAEDETEDEEEEVATTPKKKTPARKKPTRTTPDCKVKSNLMFLLRMRKPIPGMVPLAGREETNSHSTTQASHHLQKMPKIQRRLNLQSRKRANPKQPAHPIFLPRKKPG